MRGNLNFYKCYHSSDIIKPKKQIRKNQHYVVPPNKKKMVFTDICEHLHIQIPITNTDSNSSSEFEIYGISISNTNRIQLVDMIFEIHNISAYRLRQWILRADTIFIISNLTYNLPSTCCGLGFVYPSWSKFEIFLSAILGNGEPPTLEWKALHGKKCFHLRLSILYH